MASTIGQTRSLTAGPVVLPKHSPTSVSLRRHKTKGMRLWTPRFANRSVSYVGANCSRKQANAASRRSSDRRDCAAYTWLDSSYSGAHRFPARAAPLHRGPQRHALRVSDAPTTVLPASWCIRSARMTNSSRLGCRSMRVAVRSSLRHLK
jgi:hypothetical protein